MRGDARFRMKLYYDLELAKDLRRKLRFYFREIELFSASNEAHVNEILGEIYYQEMTCVDPQVRIYMARKIKELRAKHPRMKA